MTTVVSSPAAVLVAATEHVAGHQLPEPYGIYAWQDQVHVHLAEVELVPTARTLLRWAQSIVSTACVYLERTEATGTSARLELRSVVATTAGPVEFEVYAFVADDAALFGPPTTRTAVVSPAVLAVWAQQPPTATELPAIAAVLADHLVRHDLPDPSSVVLHPNDRDDRRRVRVHLGGQEPAQVLAGAESWQLSLLDPVIEIYQHATPTTSYAGWLQVTGTLPEPAGTRIQVWCALAELPPGCPPLAPGESREINAETLTGWLTPLPDQVRRAG
jgi:hypothetical protein